MKICSLLPSATEIVFELGLGESLVGVTHECDYPAAARKLPVVTSSVIDQQGSSGLEIHQHITEAVHQGTSIYELKTNLLDQLDPDLVLTQELCDVCAVSYQRVKDAVRVMEGDQTIISLEPTSLASIFDTIEEVGRVTQTGSRAAEVRSKLEARVQLVTEMAAGLPKRRVFGLEWVAPPFVGGHWVPEMIQRAGGKDGLGGAGEPSVQVSWDEILKYDPEIIIAMPCGYDIEQTISQLEEGPLPGAWRSLSGIRDGELYVVNGSAFFNRPGPRIVDGLEILAEILHPEQFSRQHDQTCWRRFR